MKGKQLSALMLAGCIGIGGFSGTGVCAQQIDGEVQYYGNEEGIWDTAEQTGVYPKEYTPGEMSYEDQMTYPETEAYTDAMSEDEWVPDYTESYNSNEEETETYEEETEERYYKEDPFISIRKSDEKWTVRDFDILTVEDAEKDFTLPSREEIPRAVYLQVPEVLQLPELPTGCESIALTMALEYEGFMLYKTTIAREFLIYNQETDNMAVGYIGDPFSKEGAGCFAPAIAATADGFFKDQGYDYQAYNLSGSEMEDLLRYVASGTPVILWATMYMAEPEFTEDKAEYEGEIYRWYYQEHCVVLSGYDLDQGTLQINDPLEGIVTRDYEEFKKIYDSVGKHAVAVKETTKDQR